MVITRRSAIRQFVIVSAGILVLPSCLQDKRKASVVLNNMSVSADQEDLLSAIAETIIPKTNTPGARDLGAHVFALRMLDDCRPAKDQQRFLAGLDAIEAQCRQKNNLKFGAASLEQREGLLHELDNAKGDSDAAFCFHLLKGYTIQAYTTSKYYLTKVHVYQLVPGAYKGCVPVSAA